MDACFLNMLHDPGDDHVSAVAQRVHVDFDCILEKVVDQDRALLGVLHRFSHIAAHRVGIIGNHHRPAAQHIGGPHQHRVADALRAFQRFLDGGHHGARRLGNIQVLEQLAKALAVFGQIDGFRRSAQDFMPAAFSGRARFNGVCPPNCTIIPISAPEEASCS